MSVVQTIGDQQRAWGGTDIKNGGVPFLDSMAPTSEAIVTAPSLIRSCLEFEKLTE